MTFVLIFAEVGKKEENKNEELIIDRKAAIDLLVDLGIPKGNILSEMGIEDMQKYFNANGHKYLIIDDAFDIFN